ncbi:MAG: radical SAM family heme chaperone HemW [Pseudomonadota bacterium]
MDASHQAEALTGAIAVPVAAQQDWRHGGFGVYVHWPFCLAKCPYCDFNSHVSRSVDQAAWLTALVAEARHMRSLTGPRRADTIFFGGGTPSLMPPETVAAIIEAVDRLWGLAPGAEITLEANPTSVEAAKFRDYATAGVNRVSMGVQALNDRDLKALGRMHSAAEARAAFDIARSVFHRVSFDLIYARMGQKLEDWEAELGEAMAMAIDHLSLYQLTIEPGTRFHDLHRIGKLTVPLDSRAADMYTLTQEMTAAAGLPAYEISNHARPGAESRHNLIYWRYGDYVGIGPGAHGRITAPDGVRSATETTRDPARWLAETGARGHALSHTEEIPPRDQALEYAMMGMRLDEGIDLARFTALAGAPPGAARIESLCESGHLRLEDGYLLPTSAGRIVLNTVLSHLLTDV